MKMGWTGLESAGKSQLMAVHAVEVLQRNIGFIKKREKMGLPFVPRIMAFDSPMSKGFIDLLESYGMKYIHFIDLSDIMPLSEIDIFINEINKFFPQRGSEPLTREQAEFLSQGAKDGINIYFCSQDFSQAHKQFRFLVNYLHYVVKLIGSERPMKSAPPVKHIWGIVLYWEIDPRTFKGDNMTMEPTHIWPNFYWINKEDTELYDTSYKVRGSMLPPVYMVQQEYIFLNKESQQVKKEVKFVKR